MLYLNAWIAEIFSKTFPEILYHVAILPILVSNNSFIIYIHLLTCAHIVWVIAPLYPHQQ
jgi:hypothetical protein